MAFGSLEILLLLPGLLATQMLPPPLGHISLQAVEIVIEKQVRNAAPGPHREDNPPPLHHDHVHPAPLEK